MKILNERNQMLKYNGKVKFFYTVKKNFGMENFGIEHQRQLELDFETLKITFPDSKGNVSSYDIDCIVSCSPTSFEGKNSYIS
jgi:hypothetical protein